MSFLSCIHLLSSIIVAHFLYEVKSINATKDPTCVKGGKAQVGSFVSSV
nr:MAG TPA: hypothetical protein [Caudoviricetes sp.]